MDNTHADEIISELIEYVQSGKKISNQVISQIAHKYVLAGNNSSVDIRQVYSKRRLIPYFLKRGRAHWGVDENTEKSLLSALQIKPRRSASGVATITVMTKPWPCSSACIYCPNDVRMPKSYLADEPVCQRAEYAFFDPYLQVISRLRALKQMGHPTDKIELIVLGGTWSDYPESYQIWYIKELFRALNDSSEQIDDDANFEDVVDTENPFKIINNSQKSEGQVKERFDFYQSLGLSNLREENFTKVQNDQNRIFSSEKTYNQVIKKLYLDDAAWKAVCRMQVADFEQLEHEHSLNETGVHRVVGLVIETRPDMINIESLTMIRRLGCTKIQMGVQSLQESVLKCNARNISPAKIAKAHNLLRLFGFKIHIHFMMNLYGSDASTDKKDYLELVTGEGYLPDEVKLYPCVLVQGTELVKLYQRRDWIPYTEDELVDVLVHDTVHTPRYTRISRMIRDISAHDIVAGNKKSNLRQVVENQIAKHGTHVDEIRYREIGTKSVDTSSLGMKTTRYETAVANEYFIEWVTPDDHIAGFLRLSIPFTPEEIATCGIDFDTLPINRLEAMIREIHIYGKTANLNKTNDSSQHRGLGKQLITEACRIAQTHGCTSINVISSVGTRQYYASLGFSKTPLYMRLRL